MLEWREESSYFITDFLEIEKKVRGDEIKFLLTNSQVIEL